MNLYFRLLIILFKLFKKSAPISPFEASQCHFRVLPNDLDVNFHMNNGRYLTIMDLARIDFMRQTTILYPVLKNKWLPVLGAVDMKFIKELRLWQRYTIHTTIDAWDEKWFVMKQTFMVGDKVHAVGRIRGLFMGSKGRIPTQEVLGLIGLDISHQSIPDNQDSLRWIRYLDGVV